ncbi:MAG: hypothetical protein HY075_10065 [Deltaproteobacteria bacterium]|nr:hypothetical protein [Deltaproteobacteria bacterium]
MAIEAEKNPIKDTAPVEGSPKDLDEALAHVKEIAQDYADDFMKLAQDNVSALLEQVQAGVKSIEKRPLIPVLAGFAAGCALGAVVSKRRLRLLQ